MKNIIGVFAIIIFFTTINSCYMDDMKQCVCTTYLQDAIWSKKTVLDCDLCVAPQGYTTTCDCD